MAKSSLKQDMSMAVHDYLERKIAAEFDEVAKKTIEDFTQRIEEQRAELISTVALRVSKNYTMQTLNDRLIITVEDRRDR